MNKSDMLRAFVDVLINIPVQPFTESQLMALMRGDASTVAQPAEGRDTSLLYSHALRLGVQIDREASDLLLHMGTDVGGAVMLLTAVVQVQATILQQGRPLPDITCQDIVGVWEGVPSAQRLNSMWVLCQGWLYRLGKFATMPTVVPVPLREPRVNEVDLMIAIHRGPDLDGSVTRFTMPKQRTGSGGVYKLRPLDSNGGNAQ